jgi:type II secretory pathway pseudopilin PulG
MSAVPARKGFTLLEVMLATGLLLGSVIVLAQLASIGREHANAAEDLATAEMLCQNRMNEILVGAAPLELVENEPLDVEDWTCTVALEPLAQPGLVALRVTVQREATPTRKARLFSLVRWIPDPGITSGDTEDSSSSPPSSGGTP